jgi:hypothetical protein
MSRAASSEGCSQLEVRDEGDVRYDDTKVNGKSASLHHFTASSKQSDNKYCISSSLLT